MKDILQLEMIYLDKLQSIEEMNNNSAIKELATKYNKMNKNERYENWQIIYG